MTTQQPHSSHLSSVIKAEALIDKNLPPGWTKEFVEPPWRGAMPGVCRGCGLDSRVAKAQKWANSALVKHDRERRVVRYSFALVCERCVQSRKVMNRLAVEVFAPLAPPGPIPENVGGKLPEG